MHHLHDPLIIILFQAMILDQWQSVFFFFSHFCDVVMGGNDPTRDLAWVVMMPHKI
jgi:hypothetical protein